MPKEEASTHPLLRERITEPVSSWPGVTVDKGRFNSTSFQLVEHEFGHLHSTLADIGFPSALREALIAEGDTKPHHVVPDSPTYTTYRIRSVDDLDHVIWLFRLSYLARLATLQQGGELDSDLDIEQELDALMPSEAVQSAFAASVPA